MFKHPAAQAADALARLAQAVTDLQSVELTKLDSDQLLTVLRDLEMQKRRLGSVDHALIAGIEQRHLAYEHGCRDTAVLLRQVLRIDPQEATGRVRAAAVLGPRLALTGEVLEPLFPAVAAACIAGALSARQARIITSTIDALPAEVQAAHAAGVENFLAKQAGEFDPLLLAKVARRLRDTLDPDGVLSDDHDRARRRDLTVQQRRDGTAHLEGELTPICAEALLSVLDALARPNPAQDGAPDRRSAGQRRHDALHDALLLLLRSDELPACNGVAATILLTMTTDQLASPSGLVRTGHGAQISADQALSLLGDAQVAPVVFNSVKGIDAYGSTQRIFTQTQRLAMVARDQGCSFPGCDVGPAWCQAHHITDYALTRHTRVDDGTLVCGFHHREHQKLGWECRMLDAVPHWIPPAWIDPERQPRRNHAHDPTGVLT